jgi:hypothetical protein
MARGAIKRGNLTLYPNWQLGADLRRTGVFDDELRRLTSDAALGAKELAVRQAFDTGAYFSSIHGELGHNKKGLRVGLVVATDFKAHWVERGWVTRSGTVVKGKNILRRGGRRAGLRVRAPRKRG